VKVTRKGSEKLKGSPLPKSLGTSLRDSLFSFLPECDIRIVCGEEPPSDMRKRLEERAFVRLSILLSPRRTMSRIRGKKEEKEEKSTRN
jgi:hypothetical protein